MFEVFRNFGMQPHLFAFGISFCLCSIFAVAPKFFIKKEHMENDLTARQAQHNRPTPRIGGVGVIAGLFMVCVLYNKEIPGDNQ